jgi:regulatory protein
VKITDIKKQVKRSDRYSIFIDGKYTFSLSENEILKLALKVNQEISSEDLINLQETASEDKAYDRALNLIMRRPRSTWEIETYLKQKKYDQEMIGKIIQRLKESRYLDDISFARSWVQNRRLLKSTSKRKLQLELRQKRVEDDITQQILDENSEHDEFEMLKQIIQKKRTQSRYADEQKLIAYLARQGFNYGDIKKALEEE